VPPLDIIPCLGSGLYVRVSASVRHEHGYYVLVFTCPVCNARKTKDSRRPQERVKVLPHAKKVK